MNTFSVTRHDAIHPIVIADSRHARFSSAEQLTQLSLAPLIDHTLLKVDSDANANTNAHARLCDEALQYGFASVCVRPEWVSWCAKRLTGCYSKTITVISFPHGTSSVSERMSEAKEALQHGAQELDTVINREALRTCDYNRVFEDIASLVTLAATVPVKVILETGLLTYAQKVMACALAKAAGAAYVKTSTGFAGDHGATTEDVHLMRTIVGHDMGVKASGGIRTAETARAMIAAGATRLGTSASVAIVTSSQAAVVGSRSNDY